MTQPGTAGTADDPLQELVTEQLEAGGGPTVTSLVGTAFESATSPPAAGTLVFTGGGSADIDDGNAEVQVNGSLRTIQAIEWVDGSGTSHTVVEWNRTGTATKIRALRFDSGGTAISGRSELVFDASGGAISGTASVGFT